MAIQPHNGLAALIKINANQGAGLESLGYAQDGVDIEFNHFTEDIFGDQNGGTDGPPIDIVDLGQTATVRMLLTSWETSVADKIAARVAGQTAGTPPVPGTLLFTDSNKIFRLLILTANQPFNFLRAVPRQPITINKGVKHSKLLFVWDCFAAGIPDGSSVDLFDAATS